MSHAIESLLFDGEEPTTREKNVWYVRIKPYNKRAGQLLRSLTLSKFGLSIREDQGWRRLTNPTDELLRALFEHRNEPGDEAAPRALDVCTIEEAKLEERREREVKIRNSTEKADVEHASALTTADLPSDRKSRKDLQRDNARRAKAERDSERAERNARRSPEAARREAEEREAERARLQREQEAAQRELEEMDAEDEALVGASGRSVTDSDLQAAR